MLESLPEGIIKFSEWQKEEIISNGKTIKKMRLQNLEKPKDDFVKLFEAEFISLRKHVFRVNNQYLQINNLRQNLQPETEITVQMDYAENFSCIFQDEPSQVFYDRNQITIHPMVVHYMSPSGNLQHQSFVGVSDEMSHTAPTAMGFISKLIPRVQMFLPNLKTIHYVTDSPSSQYRNKSIIKLLSIHAAEFGGIEATWEYLESGHGKGACDGVGGAIKKTAETAVKKGSIIKCASDFCKEVLPMCVNMNLILLAPNDVKCSARKLRNPVAVKGLSQMHSVRPCQDNLVMKDTSCYNLCCRHQPSCTEWRQTGIKIVPVVAAATSDPVVVDGAIPPVVAAAQSDLVVVDGAIPPEPLIGDVAPSETIVDDGDVVTEPVSSAVFVYKVGQFVDIMCRKKLYVCEITQHHKELEEYLVKFMKKQRNGQYVWPKVTSEMWVSFDEIQGVHDFSEQ
jgi:hypothetical protein